jgi:hypothetical protein
MIPKEQTRIGEGGNCFATALASILETPIPEFGDGRDYWQRVRAYLARHNLAYKRVPLDRPPNGWATLEGVSPRGGLHATVAYNGKFKHDPHPVSDDPRRGLAEPQYYGELMPLDKYRAGLHRALDAALDGVDAHVGMLGVNADKAKALKAQLERQGYEYRFPVAPPEDLMVRHGFVKRDKPLSEGGKNDWKILNERKNGYHNVTNL